MPISLGPGHIGGSFKKDAPIQIMPTKRRRVRVIPDNLPSQIDDDCPSVYTAAKLFKERPEVYAAIVQGLAEGMPITPMKNKYRVSNNTIGVIRQREKEVIDQSRSVLKGLTGVAAQATLEKYLERLDQNKIPDGVLPISLGILLDKVARDAGEANQVIEVKKAISLDEVREELANMRKAEPVVIEAERLEDKEPA